MLTLTIHLWRANIRYTENLAEENPAGESGHGAVLAAEIIKWAAREIGR
jgi:hypothetical protein